MAEKRKDNKGRVLFTGESQRKDGSYMYRQSDDYGKRHTVYAPTLKELREKEKQLQKDISDDLFIKNSNITVSELLKIYFEGNKQWKKSTIEQKKCRIDAINRHPISKMKICNVKPSHIKNFYIELYKNGLQKSSILIYRNILMPSFEIAVQDDWIRKNPCKFKMDFLPSGEKGKATLSREQEIAFLDFVKETKKLEWYYDIFVLMLETGMRISEIVGLTLNDIDLPNRKINVNHQLCESNKTNDGKSFRIDTLKSENGRRDIYISNKAYASILRLILRRDKETHIEIIVDGYSQFLLKSNKKSKIVTKTMIRENLRKAIYEYNQSHKDSLPYLTPHSLRHTFCTRMIENGMDIKSLQYIMGHADVRMTLDIYTHITSEVALGGMKKAIECRM